MAYLTASGAEQVLLVHSDAKTDATNPLVEVRFARSFGCMR
jgi:hypothetical protein